MQIPAPNATRWNSTYAMIEAMVSIENAHVALLSRAAEETGSTLRFTDKDCATLIELCQLLELVANATVRLEGDGVSAH